VDLFGAFFKSANLSGANLSEANLTGAVFVEASLNEANLTGAELDGAHFNGANFSGANVAKVRWNRHDMRGHYAGIRGIYSCCGNALFKRAAADQDFLDTLEDNWHDGWRRMLFMSWGIFDYGRNIWRVAFFDVVIVVIYSILYGLFPGLLAYDSSNLAHDPSRTWFAPIYFSIVTFTTLGFGDIKPAEAIGQILTSTEVIVGYVTLGLLVAVLAEKLARRS
jgi:Ion channel/Pentapeptide repeats (8 copies)